MSCSCNKSPCCCATAELSGAAYAGTLAAHLSGVVDCARGFNAQFGLRPYLVQLVWSQWSGERRGEGVEDVIRCLPITPTPKVEDLTQVRMALRPMGQLEDGNVRVSEISTKFNEDMLMGVYCGQELDPNASFYWEIHYPRSREETLRRRFIPLAVPMHFADKFMWVVDLRKVAEDRQRNGEPHAPV